MVKRRRWLPGNSKMKRVSTLSMDMHRSRQSLLFANLPESIISTLALPVFFAGRDLNDGLWHSVSINARRNRITLTLDNDAASPAQDTSRMQIYSGNRYYFGGKSPSFRGCKKEGGRMQWALISPQWFFLCQIDHSPNTHTHTQTHTHPTHPYPQAPNNKKQTFHSCTNYLGQCWGKKKKNLAIRAGVM